MHLAVLKPQSRSAQVSCHHHISTIVDTLVFFPVAESRKCPNQRQCPTTAQRHACPWSGSGCLAANERWVSHLGTWASYLQTWAMVCVIHIGVFVLPTLLAFGSNVRASPDALKWNVAQAGVECIPVIHQCITQITILFVLLV